jgi:hypothetical protein
MASAGAPPAHGVDAARVRLDGLEARVRALDPGSRALLDLSLRRRMRDDDMAPLLRIDAFHLAWRRARAIERLASALGLLDPSGLAQVRAALPHLPDSAWMATPALPPGEPETVEGEAVTIGFEALGPELRRLEDGAAQALTVRPVEVADPAAVVRPRRSALDVAVRSAAARPQAARAALLAAGGALFGALLSRRRR